MSKRKVEREQTHKWMATITKCDLCGVETQPGHDWPDQKWHEMNETSIHCTIGKVWPDGQDDRSYHRLDVCPRCFVDKFVPTVEAALGVKFHRGEVES